MNYLIHISNIKNFIIQIKLKSFYLLSSYWIIITHYKFINIFVRMGCAETKYKKVPF